MGGAHTLCEEGRCKERATGSLYELNLLTRITNPNQMICLERLDGRAFSLPFNLVPSVEMARKLVSSFLTVCVFLGPFMVNVRDKLSAELLCPITGETDAADVDTMEGIRRLVGFVVDVDFETA